MFNALRHLADDLSESDLLIEVKENRLGILRKCSHEDFFIDTTMPFVMSVAEEENWRNPKADGGITQQRICCNCGMHRYMNINGAEEERSRWDLPPEGRFEFLDSLFHQVTSLVSGYSAENDKGDVDTKLDYDPELGERGEYTIAAYFNNGDIMVFASGENPPYAMVSALEYFHGMDASPTPEDGHLPAKS